MEHPPHPRSGDTPPGDWSAGPGRPPAEPDTPTAAPSTGPPTHRTAFILLGLGGAAAAAFGIAAIGPIIAATALALTLTICTHPVRRTLERSGVPRLPATLFVLLTTLVVLAGFGFGLFLAIAQFTALLPDYLDELQTWIRSIADWLTGLGLHPAHADAFTDAIDPAELLALTTGLLGSATNLISAGVVLLTMLVAMAFDAAYATGIMNGLQQRRPHLAAALRSYVTGVRRYVLVTSTLGALQGLINWGVLALLGVPGAALWGMLSFLCSFIPNVGYFIALIPPLILGGLSGGWPTVVAVIVLYGAINAVIQSVLEPKIVGEAVKLSQTITLFSVLFWAVILGPIGALLAVPITLLIRALLVEANPHLSWIRPALGDRTPPADPHAAEEPHPRPEG